jgi:hypothetical protein
VIRRCLVAAALGLTLPSVGAVQAPGDPFAFFQPTVTVTPDERARLHQGEPVVRVLGGAEGEVAVFAALPLHVIDDRLADWVRHIDQLKKGFALAIGRFSDPPRIEDLEALTLDDDDIVAVARCRPGACGIKVTASELERLQNVITGPPDRWRPLLQLAFRQVVLERVQQYLAGGLRAFPQYADRRDTTSRHDAFAALLARSSYLVGHAPDLARYLVQYPQPGVRYADSFL